MLIQSPWDFPTKTDSARRREERQARFTPPRLDGEVVEDSDEAAQAHGVAGGVVRGVCWFRILMKITYSIYIIYITTINHHQP